MSDFGGTWYLVRSGQGAHDHNMALDEALLISAPELGRPVLRFYGWSEPAASFGYFQKYSEIELVTKLRPLVRRPTGGGLVPHDADWTYSLAFPPDHPWYGLTAVESYRRVHQWVCDAFATLAVTASLAPVAVKEVPGQCFVGAEKSDVLWNGKKIAGAAQRRTRQGLLIQGSVQPPRNVSRRADWDLAMCECASRQMGVEWLPLAVEGNVAELAENLRQTRYSQASFNQRR